MADGSELRPHPDPAAPRRFEEELGRETILGIDNIALDLPIAGLGSRVLSATIDYAILVVVLVATLSLAFGALAALGAPPGWLFAALLGLYFVIEWGYFASLELVAKGRTFGKMAVRLRVVGREGGAPTAPALLMRNLLRIPDLIVGLPLIAFDPLARRLGDRLAGTLVVHDRRGEAELRLGRIPTTWGAREVALVESYLHRAREMEPSQSRHLARRLLGLLQRDAPELLAGVETHDAETALRRALDVQEG